MEDSNYVGPPRQEYLPMQEKLLPNDTWERFTTYAAEQATVNTMAGATILPSAISLTLPTFEERRATEILQDDNRLFRQPIVDFHRQPHEE